jgi:hypothetical protein
MLSTAVTNGWISKQTAIEKLGFDPTIERDRLNRESAEDIKQQRAGLKPIDPETQNMLGMKADMMAKDAKANGKPTNG